MGEIQFMGAVLLTAVFAVAIFGYISGVGTDNNVDILNDSDFVAYDSNLNADLALVRTQTNDSSTAFYESTIASGDTTTTTGGQFKGGMISALTSLKRTIGLAYTKIFGNDNNGMGVALTALLTFMVFIAIRYIWKTWAGHSPD